MLRCTNINERGCEDEQQPIIRAATGGKSPDLAVDAAHRRVDESWGSPNSVRRALDTYLLCLQHGADYAKEAKIGDPPDKWINNYVDTLSECAEKSWQDFRNNWQILLLTQDEALMWVAKIERAWANAG